MHKDTRRFKSAKVSDARVTSRRQRERERKKRLEEKERGNKKKNCDLIRTRKDNVLSRLDWQIE